jgi:hypothetical protein
MQDMERIAGGRFLMGSDEHYAEEAPVHPSRGRSVLDRPQAGHQEDRLGALDGSITVCGSTQVTAELACA